MFRFILSPLRINPLTPKSDQCQISPAASLVILHHTAWRTFIAFRCFIGRKTLVQPNSHCITHRFLHERVGEFWTWDLVKVLIGKFLLWNDEEGAKMSRTQSSNLPLRIDLQKKNLISPTAHWQLCSSLDYINTAGDIHFFVGLSNNLVEENRTWESFSVLFALLFSGVPCFSFVMHSCSVVIMYLTEYVPDNYKLVIFLHNRSVLSLESWRRSTAPKRKSLLNWKTISKTLLSPSWTFSGKVMKYLRLAATIWPVCCWTMR